VLQHHERWDGAGYSGALREGQIDIGARIFHVADALDAMTSHRPYPPIRSFAEAIREVRNLRATQFEPDVVDAFAGVSLEEWKGMRLEAPQSRPRPGAGARTRRLGASWVGRGLLASGGARVSTTLTPRPEPGM